MRLSAVAAIADASMPTGGRAGESRPLPNPEGAWRATISGGGERALAVGTQTMAPAIMPLLGLPLTEALAEASHATFNIRSTPNEGTLVEIAFPGARLLAAQ
jgi:hypothetical protein